MEKLLYYNNYYFKLEASEDLHRYNYADCKLLIYNQNNEIVKEFKIEYDSEFYYKILKTKIKSNDILSLFDKIDSNIHISKIFFNKLIDIIKKVNNE